jgi:hypothetical protein
VRTWGGTMTAVKPRYQFMYEYLLFLISSPIGWGYLLAFIVAGKTHLPMFRRIK